MAILCREPDEVVSTKELAGKLDASGYHLSKVLQRLTKAGFVKAERGPTGGFKLRKPADAITIADIYKAIEGPLDFDKCLMHEPVCKGNRCIMNGLSESIVRDMTNLFNRTTLSMIDDVM